MPPRAYGINCTLTPDPEPSSTQKMLVDVLEAIAGYGFQTSHDRLVGLDIRPGVRADEGDGDDWPGVRRKILGARIGIPGIPEPAASRAPPWPGGLCA